MKIKVKKGKVWISSEERPRAKETKLHEAQPNKNAGSLITDYLEKKERKNCLNLNQFRHTRPFPEISFSRNCIPCALDTNHPVEGILLRFLFSLSFQVHCYPMLFSVTFGIFQPSIPTFLTSACSVEL